MERPRRNDRDDDRGSSRSRERDDDRGSRSRGSRGSRGSLREEAEPRRSSRDRDDDRGASRGGRDRDDDRGSRRSGREERGSGSSRGFTYAGRSAEDLKKRASQGANDFDKIVKDGVKMYKVQDGENRIRILPPTWKGAKHYGLDIFVHYGVGPDRASYIDLQKMKGEPDPISEERDCERSSRDPDEKYVKELDSKKRVGIWLIDRNAEKEGVQFWAMPWTVDRDIVTVSVDRDTGEVLPVDDPVDGYDVIFDKSGQKDRTEYKGVSVARRSSPLGKDEWLDYAVDNPIPEVLEYYPYEHIAKAFGGKGEQRDSARDDDKDDHRSSRSRDDKDDDRDFGGRRSSRDEPARGRRSAEPEEPNWESVHQMTATELEDLIEQEKLDIDPRDAKDDEDLADWICEEMKLTKVEKAQGRRRVEDAPKEEKRRSGDADPEDKLAEMRRRREGDDRSSRRRGD